MLPIWPYILEQKFNALLENGVHFVNIVGEIYSGCSDCDFITTDGDVEQIDLILPMYDCIANGDQLQAVFDKYINGIVQVQVQIIYLSQTIDQRKYKAENVTQ